MSKMGQKLVNMEEDRLEAVRRAVFKLVDAANFTQDFRSIDATNQILSLKDSDGNPLIGVIAKDQELPNEPYRWNYCTKNNHYYYEEDEIPQMCFRRIL